MKIFITSIMIHEKQKMKTATFKQYLTIKINLPAIKPIPKTWLLINKSTTTVSARLNNNNGTRGDKSRKPTLSGKTRLKKFKKGSTITER
ncbi:MAG: hypothetical protein A2355_15105 [Spirochaetes bacterium RIFOXYB1_FULL_32_8]|nr:MAG: hypothetical protein A2355_15105 [Spirochaetes bacterium RIFOXYB1_FULL_32_8]